MPGLQPDLTPGTKEAQLKAAVRHAIGQTVDELSATQKFNTSTQFIGGLTEMCWTQLETVAQELEAFARHDGGREVIRAKDVVLLGRKNEGLEEALKALAEEIKESDEETREKR